MIDGQEPALPPPVTMLGALYRYMREADPAHFQPMNANFGLVDDLANPIRDKKRKREMIAERALGTMSEWRRAIGASNATEVETGVQVAAGS
jgi:methylenetetrahydrofolate--tRNA-(uracil-5-)-methyltransferase